MKKIFTLILIFLPQLSLAENCNNYPLTQGIDISAVEGSEIPKIISTGKAIPFSIDVSDVDDALTEARLEAKAGISRFMNEISTSDTKIDEAVSKLQTVENGTKTSNSSRLKVIFKSLGESSSSLLRGVVVIGDCYTEGKEVRVTVGIKPETLELATGLVAGQKKSFKKTSSNSGITSEDTLADTNDKDNNTSENMNEADEANNSKKIKDF
jgi:hypothetical protein